MQPTQRSIFRTDAVRRYVQARELAVLPHLVRPRNVFALWGLLGLLSVAGTWLFLSFILR